MTTTTKLMDKSHLQQIVAAALLGLGLLNLRAAETKSSLAWPAAHPAAVAHWQSLRFGMFIHWGPVSLTGHEGNKGERETKGTFYFFAKQIAIPGWK